MFEFRITGVSYGRDDDCTVRMISGNRVFEVLLSADGPDGSVEREYIRRIWYENEVHSDATFNELYDLVVRLARPYIFQNYVEQENETIDVEYTLHDVLNPPTTKLQLLTNDGEPKLILLHDSMAAVKANHLPFVHIKEVPEMPIYESSQIKVLGTALKKKMVEHYPLDSLLRDSALKVMIGQSIQCAKVSRSFSYSWSLRREINCLHRVKSAKVSRTPTIHGVIVAEENPCAVIGFVTNFIPSITFIDGQAWEHHEVDRWADEIEDTVQQLHDIGIIWGDVKADNLLFHQDSNGSRLKPYIIDFGGSRTEGWVDKDLVETKEGDLQGLQRIRTYFNRYKR